MVICIVFLNRCLYFLCHYTYILSASLIEFKFFVNIYFALDFFYIKTIYKYIFIYALKHFIFTKIKPYYNCLNSHYLTDTAVAITDFIEIQIFCVKCIMFFPYKTTF